MNRHTQRSTVRCTHRSTERSTERSLDKTRPVKIKVFKPWSEDRWYLEDEDEGLINAEHSPLGSNAVPHANRIPKRRDRPSFAPWLASYGVLYKTPAAHGWAEERSATTPRPASSSACNVVLTHKSAPNTTTLEHP
jgi:hypothetical protein